jgi:hypothetical protein
MTNQFTISYSDLHILSGQVKFERRFEEAFHPIRDLRVIHETVRGLSVAFSVAIGPFHSC